nr:agamous-like MADS-box protein AGL12 [Ipomoea batatas]GMD66552.1 agamous-like MADS-box protein AGL12 [Ipomoea batatas]
MTVDELHALEKYLEVWMYQIRSAKMDIMFQEIQLLKNKVYELNSENALFIKSFAPFDVTCDMYW